VNKPLFGDGWKTGAAGLKRRSMITTQPVALSSQQKSIEEVTCTLNYKPSQDVFQPFTSIFNRQVVQTLEVVCLRTPGG
jgi:hypothetical protein